ncbi:MAG: DUF4397 domain-containing protein, partial [Bacteroidetes bacterium]|jgi:hypothetical protein|nr:DUF4397 domain-containing protein [Bacteroidota bacterium]
VSNVTTDSADLSWDDVANATDGYEWFVFASGDDPATATPVASGLTSAGVTTANPTALSSATTYDVYVRSNCAADGLSDLLGPETFTTLALPPANDECSNAVSLTVNADLNCTNVTSGTTAGATASSQADDVTGTPDNDVWFSFVATETQHEISLQNVQAVIGTSTDMGMGLYDGSGGCSALTLVDDSDPNTLLAGGLTIGTTYFVRVYGWSSSNTAQTDFDICVGTPPPPPANDDCSGALPLTVTTDNTTFTTFSTDFASEGANELTDCDGFGNLGVWYSFTAPAASLEFLQGANGDPGITIFEGPDCNSLTELTATCINNDSGTITGLTPGNDYYAMVWTDSAQATAEFVLFFEQCPSPSNLSVSNITQDSADLSWDDVPEATSGYEWFVFASGDDPLTATPIATATVAAGVTSVTVPAGTLSSGTPYDFYVSSDCDADGISNLSGPESFSTLFENDECSGALPATVTAFGDTSQPISFDTTGAQDATVVPSCEGFDSDEQDLWYTFTTNSADSVVLSLLSGTAGDIEGAVYDACGGAELFCFADGSSVDFSSDVFVTGLTPNTTYFLQLYTESFAEGAFSLAITDPPPPAQVQIIHNSADPAAEFVDVYLNGDLLLDDFEFRTSTPFVDVPAGAPIDIDIAPGTSTDVSDSIFNLNTTLTADETYVVVANGVLDPAQFDSSVNTIDFNLDVFAGAQQASTNAGETSLLVHHGSTDAPTVDVAETLVGAGIIVDDISYTEFQGYLDLANLDYEINIELADNSAVVAAYEAPLQTLGLADAAITVVASGFLDPANNQTGPAFGLWVALPAGGALIPLPEKSIGTETFNEQNFSFYPNPAQNKLNLQTTGQVEEVKVYNMLGQQVMKETPNTVSPSLNVEALQVGSYIMNVTIDGSSENFRFIKE